MALSDEEKLDVSVDAFKRKLDSIETWTAFKSMLNNITKTMVVNFLKGRIGDSADSYEAGAAQNTAKAADLDDLVNEFDSI